MLPFVQVRREFFERISLCGDPHNFEEEFKQQNCSTCLHWRGVVAQPFAAHAYLENEAMSASFLLRFGLIPIRKSFRVRRGYEPSGQGAKLSLRLSLDSPLDYRRRDFPAPPTSRASRELSRQSRMSGRLNMAFNRN